MTAAQPTATERIYDHLVTWDRDLKAGDLVEIRWTCSNRYHAARATVERINAQSIRCRLVEALDGYPVGHHITSPRILSARWSGDNGVFPVPPLQGILIDAQGARIARPARRDSAIEQLFTTDARDGLVAEMFYVSTHVELHKGPLFVALRDRFWCGKQLPVHNRRIPLCGDLFIVRRPYNDGGYWRSLTTKDVGAFEALFNIKVAWGDVQKGDIR